MGIEERNSNGKDNNERVYIMVYVYYEKWNKKLEYVFKIENTQGVQTIQEREAEIIKNSNRNIKSETKTSGGYIGQLKEYIIERMEDLVYMNDTIRFESSEKAKVMEH